MNKLYFVARIALLLSASAIISLAQSPGSPWTFMGPQPIKSTNVGDVYQGFVGPMPIAGRVSAVAVVDLKTAYIGTSGGGVWKTIDGGLSWRPKTDSQPSLTIGALALDPTDKNTIYAGTGEFIPYYDEYNGVGILRSSDAGETWELLPDPAGVFKGTSVARIAVDPGNPKNIYVATSHGLAMSFDKGQSWSVRNLGVCSSITDVVIDGSKNPSRVYVASSPGDFVTSSDESCSGVWKAATDKNEFIKANGVVPYVGKSPNPQGLPAGHMDTLRLAIYPGNSGTVLYAAMWAFKTEMNVFKSSDGGDHWIRLPGDVTTDGPFQIAIQKILDPSTNKYVPVIYIISAELYISKDDGQSWKNITSNNTDKALDRKVHHDMHGLDFIPGYPGWFYLGTDGGIYISANYGLTIHNMNDTLGNVHFYRGAVSNDLNPVLIGSMHDSGFVVSTGVNREWTRVSGGDGGSIIWDPQDTKRVYMVLADSGNQPLVVYRSTNGGQGPFNSASNGLPKPPPANENLDFITPLALDPKHPKHLYVASSQLYTSADGADTWKAAGPPTGMNFPGAGTAITAIGVADGAVGINVYVARGKNVFKLLQALTGQFENSWTNVSNGLPTTGSYMIRTLAVDPANPNTVYAGLHPCCDPAIPPVMKFNGTKWVSASKNLPHANVNSIVVNPNNSKDIFVAMDEGVYRSTDGGDNWFSINNGMPNAIAWDVVLNPSGSTLYVFTHGRGVWRANVKDLLTVPTPKLQPQIRERIALPSIHVDQIPNIDARRARPRP